MLRSTGLIAALVALGACGVHSDGAVETPDSGGSDASPDAVDTGDASAAPDGETGTGPVGGPLTYTARTDLGEDLQFLGKNHMDQAGAYHPDQLPPDIGGLVGANQCVTDPDFGSKICRVTDFTLGASFSSGAASADLWAADGSAFVLHTGSGSPLLFAFSNDDAMQSTVTNLGKIVPAGDATHFASRELTFSPNDPNTLYELDFGRTDPQTHAPIVVLNTLTISRSADPSKWSIDRKLLFDFEESNGKCLPPDFVPTWAGTLNVSNDDGSFQISFSDHGQNGARDANHPYGATLVAAFDRGKGCRVLHTYGTDDGSGHHGPMTITGDWGDVGAATNGDGAALGQTGGDPLPDTFYLHDSGPFPNGAFSGLSGSEIVPSTADNSSCVDSKNQPQLCGNYYWETGTRNVRPVDQSGHAAKGYLYVYKGKKYFALDPHAPAGPRTPLLGLDVPVDQHGTYSNGDDQDDQPVFLISSNVCGQAPGVPGSGACDPQYSGPLYDEIFAVENQAAHADAQHCTYGGQKSGCVYRFAHTFNSGTNWNFFVQNAESGVSPTGRFLLFPSDWALTLGCTNGQASGCLDNVTASTKKLCANDEKSNACQRGDVFVVRLQ